MAKIGFIGLGLMGAPMAHRLIDRGHELTVLSGRAKDAVAALEGRGAASAPTPKAVAEAAEIVMLCVDTSASVESLMEGEDGVIAGLSAGDVVVDFGTSLPASTRRLGALVAEKGAAMLDAPLGRTPAHAKDGLLNIMGAGDEDAFARARPVLEDLGENVFHLGPLGSGHTVKLMNNFFGMTTANAMAEAFAVADRAGVPRKLMHQVMAAGPLHSGMMDFVAAYGVDGDPSKLEFSIQNACKDVGYYVQMTEDAGYDSLIAPGPLKGLKAAVDAGEGEKMVSQIVDFYAKR